MKTVKFADVQLGDELLAVTCEPERLVTQDDPLLWSDVAAVSDGSPNWLWRVTAVVLAVRNDPLALDDYIASLVVSLRGESGDLVVKEGQQTLRTYPDCRLDRVTRSAPKDPSRGNFDARLTFRFTTTTDPEGA